MIVTPMQIQAIQLKRSVRLLTSSSGDKKWPLVHPNRRRLQNLKIHLTRDELLARPPSLAPIKNKQNIPEPAKQDLKIIALHASIPFVGKPDFSCRYSFVLFSYYSYKKTNNWKVLVSWIMEFSFLQVNNN